MQDKLRRNFISNIAMLKVTIQRVTNWERVVNAARFTQRKEPLGHEPSSEFKSKMVKAEHSPLRLLEFDVQIFDIPYYCMGHLVRHVHAQPFVSTSRPDITGSGFTRHDMPQDAPVNLQLSLNAQELINISRFRLCTKAEATTRRIWAMVVEELRKIEPELADMCVRNCIYRGMCPEMVPCAYEGFIRKLDNYGQYH